MTTSPGWYLKRLSRMGPAEIAGRVTDTVRRRRWRDVVVRPPGGPASWPRPALSTETLAAVPAGAKSRLVTSADRIMDGYAEYFGITRDDMAGPDWAYCPKTGRRAPDGHAFDIPYRREEIVGDIKQIWEPSRHQHLTVLATAYALTGQDHYAGRVADHLKSWWAANPPGRGVHWVSGIELGIRLISWVWVRRLLHGWPGAPALFEENPEARNQIWHHQRWLADFPSRGSSANNHVIAEAAGRLAAASAFGWFPESARWQADAARSLDEHLRRNTFGSGLNRELATEYHGLVLELGLVAALEAEAAGFTVPRSTWTTLVRMTDALASIVDEKLHPPRQGDADDGHGLVLDGAGTGRWASLLATGEVLFGRLSWWPEVPMDDVRTPLLTAGATRRPPAWADRPSRRPAHFADAGLTILRAGDVWCRCDGGPHGFLSIAAHAHADALSVEVRHGGVDILADPGTFCYHGQQAWRSYFRSTLGHNTLELGGRDQSVSGGPFLWTRHAHSKVLFVHTPKTGAARWSAEHDGYRPIVHRRSVELDATELTIVDEVHGTPRHPCRLAFHLGPAVDVHTDGTEAQLTWPGGRGVLALPADLSWRAHRGETDPPLGWYSPGFGRREPAYVLIGTGFTTEKALTTVLRFEALP